MLSFAPILPLSSSSSLSSSRHRHCHRRVMQADIREFDRSPLYATIESSILRIDLCPNSWRNATVSSVSGFVVARCNFCEIDVAPLIQILNYECGNVYFAFVIAFCIACMCVRARVMIIIILKKSRRSVFSPLLNHRNTIVWLFYFSVN